MGHAWATPCQESTPTPSILLFFSLLGVLRFGLREEEPKFISKVSREPRCFEGLFLAGITAKKFDFTVCVPKKGIGRPQSQFSHSCVCERYSYVRPTSFPAAEEADRSEEYINRSQKHECRSWDCFEFSVLCLTVEENSEDSLFSS
jgi:hypothetical protein